MAANLTPVETHKEYKQHYTSWNARGLRLGRRDKKGQEDFPNGSESLNAVTDAVLERKPGVARGVYEVRYNAVYKNQ